MSHSIIDRKLNFIGCLPQGYEYTLLKVGNTVKILGASPVKAAIAFILSNNELIPIDLKKTNGAID